MASDFEAQLKEEARPFLEPGEEIVASIVAQPRGTSTAKAGGLGPSSIGSAWAGKSKKAGKQAGLALTNPMALAVSDKRLLVFAIETSAMVKRLLVGKVLTVGMGGNEVKLEVGSGEDAKGLAAEFERAKASA